MACSGTDLPLPRKLFQSPLTCIRVLHEFPQSLLANAMIMSWNRPQLLISVSFQFTMFKLIILFPLNCDSCNSVAKHESLYNCDASLANILFVFVSKVYSEGFKLIMGISGFSHSKEGFSGRRESILVDTPHVFLIPRAINTSLHPVLQVSSEGY
jgi:hypothetical protein